MATLEPEGLTDILRCEIVRDHPCVIERSPLVLGQIEHFGCAHRQRNHDSIREITKGGRQITLAEIDQAGSIVDDDARHWIIGPLICCSTESSDWLRSAAARTGEINSSPTA